MTVKVSKPAINVREELADLRKPTGLAGEAMLRAETPQEQFNLIGAGRRNLIINGAMQVAQRGTSFTNPNEVYTLDRFMARAGTGGALTVSQQSMDYGQTHVPNIQNFVRLAQTTARTGAFSFFWQRVEDVTRFDNTTVTISFYAKCSVDKQIRLSTYQDFGTSGSSDVVVDNTEFNIETSWKRFEVTMHCPSINGKTVNAGSHLLIEFRDQTLGTFTLDVTGIQLEYGKVATPFEHRSYGEELALAQRFYERFNGQSEWLMAHGYNADIYATIDWKVPKRIAGGAVTYSNSDFSNIITAYGNTSSSAAIDGVITGVVTATASITGLSLSIDLSSGSYTPYGTSVMWRVDNSHWIAYDAEL